MLTTVALVFIAVLSVLAQSGESSYVTVNSNVLDRKVIWIYTSSTTFGEASVPRVAIEYAPLGDEWSYETDLDEFHPAVVRVLFGAVFTGAKDLLVREIEPVENGDLRFGGLRAGERVAVYNTNGRLCLTTTASEDGAIVGMKRLPRGIYVIKAGSTAFKYINR